MSAPGLRVLFHETGDHSFRSIAPVTKRDQEAFSKLLAQFNLPPAQLSTNGRLICDKTTAETLASAGKPLNVRQPTRSVV